MEIPDVSIIVLNWNKSAMTLRCVQNVRDHTPSLNYEIIVIDNGSKPAELADLKEGLSRDGRDRNSRLVSLSRNMFFGEGCNIGAEAARGQYLLFLNNDTLVTSGAVENLLAQYKSLFSAGAIGPKLLYPNGSLQEAGAFVLADGTTIQQGGFGIEPHPHFASGTHIVDYCSAACLLVEKDVFIAHDGFDPMFDPAYFEDVDHCFRLRADGLYTYYASGVTVYHELNATSSVLWSRDEIDAIVRRNQQKFMQRWSTHLETRLHAPPPRPANADTYPPPPPKPKGRILLRSGTTLQDSPDCAAMLQCAAALENKYEITLAAPEICSRLRIDSLTHKLGFHLSRPKIARLADVDGSIYDHTISFPDSAFGGKPLSNLESMKMLFDRL